MEFTRYYPTTNEAETPASPPSLPPSPSNSLYPSHFYPAASQSYAVQAAGVYRPLDAVTDAMFAQKSDDPLGQFLTAKKRVLGQSAEDLLSLIYERQGMKYDNTRQLMYESAHLGSQLLQLGDSTFGAFKDVDKTRLGLEKDIAGLERERRMEEISCWKDITSLKGELRETMQDFNMEKRKEHFFTVDTQ